MTPGQTLAEVLHETVRESDIAGRSGGEEFLVILPQTNGESAHIVGERMRAAVDAALYRSKAAGRNQVAA